MKTSLKVICLVAIIGVFCGVANAKQEPDYWSIQSLNTEKFLCELETGEFLQIVKNVYRIDDYSIKAFGHIYTVYGINSGPGIADKLIVKNTTVKQFEPTTIIFNSPLGEPTDIVVHLQGGRAPLQYNIKCEQIN